MNANTDEMRSEKEYVVENLCDYLPKSDEDAERLLEEMFKDYEKNNTY